MTQSDSDILDKVYSATTREENEGAYDARAGKYDTDAPRQSRIHMSDVGYSKG